MCSEALSVHTPGANADLIARRLEKGANLWEEGEMGGASIRSERRTDDEPALDLDLQVFWHERETDYTLAVELGDNDRLPSFVARRRHISEESGREWIAFFRSRMLDVFDVLEPPWGCADLFDRIGFGTDTNPKEHVHWLNFYGPDNEARARALADDIGVEVDEREWGGFVVQAWEDPFDPPEEHKPTPDPTTVQAPASPLDDEEADQYPRNGVLVAGVDPFEATTLEGETLAEDLAGEGAGVEDLAAHFHAARQAGEDFDPGELRLFPSFRHNACILGVPVAKVPVTAETPPIEPLDDERLGDALRQAGAALDRLDIELDAEPCLHLLICDTAGTEGI